MINDGSTDNSFKICDEYEHRDKRVKVIHKVNEGVAIARNTGIDVATGTYILFIDSDDFIAKDSIIKIVEQLNKEEDIDIMFLEAYKFYTNQDKSVPLGDGYIADKIINKSKKEVLSHLATLRKYQGGVWAKLISLKLIKENNLYFSSGVIIGEDLEFVLEMILSAKRFSYCNVKYYYRQSREGSATSTFSVVGFNNLFNFIKKYEYTDNNLILEFKDDVYSFLVYEYIILLSMYDNLTREEKSKYKKEINFYRYLFKYRIDKKTKLVEYCYKIFGLDITSKLLNLYLKVR